MSVHKLFLVGFIDWTLYETGVQAPSEADAIECARQELANHGTKGFRSKDAGDEHWYAEEVGS